MKKALLLLAFPLVLVGCGNTSEQTSVQDLIKNPLFAERYAEELVDTLVELEIFEDPLLQDEAKKKYIDKARKKWLDIAREARSIQREGSQGNFLSMKEYTHGEVLYHHPSNMLYFDTTFETTPGPSLHVFITTVVDPRDVEFPDETSMDLGTVFSAYDTQQYSVPVVDNPVLYRTVVLWDTELDRLYGFAQLNVN